MPEAVLLLSGGLDSTTMLAHAIDAGFDVHAMTFRYGQRHAAEIEAARRVARHYGVRDHVVVDIDLRTFGGSALKLVMQALGHRRTSPDELAQIRRLLNDIEIQNANPPTPKPDDNAPGA